MNVTPAVIAFAVLLSVGLAGNLVLLLGAWRLARRKRDASPRTSSQREAPPVTILKPLKGADPGLEENLRSFFTLDYPHYQLLLGVASPTDPAADIARRVLADYPAHDSLLVVDAAVSVPNPKVANLANMDKHGRHSIVLISDSNVRVEPGYLRDMVDHLKQPRVGLVTSAFRVDEGKGLGGELERLQLHTWVVGGLGAANRLLAQPVAVGKSMMLRRSTLDAIGGWNMLGRYIAEDQVCAEEVARRGMKVAVARDIITNVAGRMTLRAFLSRHVRWGILRKRIAPVAFACEILFNPVVLALAALAVAPCPATCAVLAAALLGKACIDAALEQVLSARRPWFEYVWLTPVREGVVTFAWLVAIARSTVTWRGARYRVGKRTLAVADPIPPQAQAADARNAWTKAAFRVKSAMVHIARSLVVGGGAVIADLAVLGIAIGVFGMDSRQANIPSLAAGAVVQFFGNRYFVYRSSRAFTSMSKQAIGFVLAEAVTLTLNAFLYDRMLMAFPCLQTGAWPLVARLIAGNIVFVLWALPAWYVVFRPRIRQRNGTPTRLVA